MDVLVVGSAALDSIETPFGKADDVLGGSAIYFSSAASNFTKVHVVAVVGEDFPMREIGYLKQKRVNFSGLMVEKGKTFRWGGKYDFDVNNRETLFTHLNVFENFNPTIPDSYKDIPYVFLANIQPELQLQVLLQINRPKLVVMDTMNFWIEGTPDSLQEVLKLVDILIINDSEVRQLAKENNLLKASKIINKMGPHTLVIKKGEHGALLVTDSSYFIAPAYPLEKVIDPTGAGDTFAGGFVGYLAKVNDSSPAALRRAVVYGSTLGSFCVEGFSVERLRNLTEGDINSRYQEFVELTKFEST
jgi:sugar/nucleoside kinase (ribokinase family)